MILNAVELLGCRWHSYTITSRVDSHRFATFLDAIIFPLNPSKALNNEYSLFISLFN